MVQVYFTDEGGTLRVDVKGHGELGNFEGLDVMCAATTVLTNTLSINVLTYKELDMLDEEPTVYVGDDGEGRARVACRPKPEYYAVVRAGFRGVVMGYQMLAAVYPGHVEFCAD